jgi:hypothetical protein
MASMRQLGTCAMLAAAQDAFALTSNLDINLSPVTLSIRV